MEHRRMGDSSIECSALGFGTWEMGTTQYGPIDVGQAISAVHSALDQGITLFDTAEVYGPYHSEEILGKALGARRKDVTLVTKVGFVYTEDNKVAGRDASRATVLSHAEDCLRRLGTDWIDLLLIHWPDNQTPHEETIGALSELKQAGKIREYGVSNYTVEMMEACEKYGHLAANQVGYHLFDRRMEARIIPYCVGKGIGFMGYGTLGFGLLTGAFNAETSFVKWDWRSRGQAFGLPLFEREPFLKSLAVVKRLQDLAAQYDRTVAQLAIAWVLSNPGVSVALVGARTSAEIAENIKAVSWRLDEAIKEQIDLIFTEEGVPTHRDTPQAAGMDSNLPS